MIYTVGEVVYDIIFKNHQPVSGNPGGSKFNTAISLGRIGLPVSFIGETGDDEIGSVTAGFLSENGVNTAFFRKMSGMKSSIALAFLNEKNEASYQFHKYAPEKPLDFKLPLPVEGDVVLFGSYYSLQRNQHERLMNFVSTARKNGAVVVYDPNIRKPHKGQISELMSIIHKNISMADIIRASDEDMMNILDSRDHEKAWHFIKDCGCSRLFLTSSTEVLTFTDSLKLTIDVPVINPVSTIGAGDTFNAGLIAGLTRSCNSAATFQEISAATWTDILVNAILMAQQVCMSMENYLPKNYKL